MERKEHPDSAGRRFRCSHWSMRQEICYMHMTDCDVCFLFDRMSEDEYRDRAREWGLRVQKLLFEEGDSNERQD